MRRTKLFFLIFLFSLFFLLSKPEVSASYEQLFENFDSLNSELWTFYPNDGSIIIEGGKIFISAEKTESFPLVHLNDINPFPTEGNFILEIAFEYTRVTSKGVGFSIGTAIPPNLSTIDTPINDPMYSKYKFFHIWQDIFNNLLLAYTGNCFNTSDCTLEEIVKFRSSENDFNKHLITLKYMDGKYGIFMDGSLKYTSPETEIRPTTIWFGNNSIQGPGDPWTSFKIDYIKVFKPPILVFLPGMKVCWNNALLSGNDADNWRLIPFLGPYFYNNIFNSFNNAGLEKDKDWYLFCYDWRKPLAYNAEKLNDFILAQVNTPENGRLPTDSVNLVGHSMGGLISRAYAQTYSEKVNTTVALGSPHEGVINAYPAWEGGQQWEEDVISKILFELAVKINREPLEHLMHTIRRLVPSVKDFLPTFDFLVDQKSGVYKNIITHKQQNETMNGLNGSLTETDKLNMGLVYGNGEKTLDAIKVTSINIPVANWVHQRLGLWEDGEPTHTSPTALSEYTDGSKDYSSSMIHSNQGDGTVLVKSATINGVESYEISTNHIGVVKTDEAIQHVFNFLGIAGSPSTSLLDTLKGLLAFHIKSPAKITVTAPDGKQAGYEPTGSEIENNFYDDEANFLIIPNPDKGVYQLKIKGTGEGSYRFLIAQASEDDPAKFVEYEFPTHEDKIDLFSLNFDEEIPALEDPQGLLALESAKTKIKKFLDELAPICKERTSLILLNWTEKLIRRGKYQEAAQSIKAYFGLLNKCVFDLEDEALLSLFDSYHSAANDLISSYLAYANQGEIRPDPNKIRNLLQLKEKALIWKSMQYQRLTDMGQEVPFLKTILFEEASSLVQEAKENLEKSELIKAHILEFQVEFFLFKLFK